MSAIVTQASQDDAVRVAKEAFTYYVLGDTEGLLGLITDETVSRFPGDPAIVPWAGTYLGREIERFHDRIKDTIDLLEFTVHAYEAKGDTVIATAREVSRVKATGKNFVSEMVGIVTVRNGKIVRYLEYSDTAAIQAACTE